MLLVGIAGLLSGCLQAEANPERRPQQTGQPMDQAVASVRILKMQAAAMTGNDAMVRREFDGIHQDMMRSMKIADPARRIDPESARSVVHGLPGVRSVAWVDRENLLIRVNDAASRSQRGIDQVCMALEPLGDTLAVVVHLQDASARGGSALDTLSRNCQLQPGDHAFLHTQKRMDVLEPEVRAQYHASRERLQPARRAPMSAGDRAALEAIPEM